MASGLPRDELRLVIPGMAGMQLGEIVAGPRGRGVASVLTTLIASQVSDVPVELPIASPRLLGGQALLLEAAAVLFIPSDNSGKIVIGGFTWAIGQSGLGVPVSFGFPNNLAPIGNAQISGSAPPLITSKDIDPLMANPSLAHNLSALARIQNTDAGAPHTMRITVVGVWRTFSGVAD